jgi:hypothetical protein
MLDMEDNNAPRLRQLLQRAHSSPLHVVVGKKHLQSGIPIPYGTVKHPKSFEYYNTRWVSLDRPNPPDFSPIGLPIEKFPFITQREFDGFVERCATLDAIARNTHEYYVTPETLRRPMPHLRTLRLGLAGDSQVFGWTHEAHSVPGMSANELPFPFFQNITPRLRQLCFDYVHARWNDPIYQNLTNLRLHQPDKPASLMQILRILRSCPELTDLELSKCLRVKTSTTTDEEPSISTPLGVDIVSLPKLKYLHYEDYSGAPTISFLSSISLPMLEYLYLDTSISENHWGSIWNAPPVVEDVSHELASARCFTDQVGCPFKSIVDTITRPVYLRVDGENTNFSLEARYNPPGIAINKQCSDREIYDNEGWVRIKVKEDEQGWWKVIGRAKSGISTGWGDSNAFDDDPNLDPSEWNAASISFGQAPTLPVGSSTDQESAPIHSPLHPSIVPPMVRLSEELLHFIENASLGGVQYDQVKKLQISNFNVLPDTFYTTLFERCHMTRKLKMSYNRGLGVLSAVVKDNLLPELEEVYLVDNDNVFGFSVLPEILVDWVEMRQTAATRTRRHDRKNMEPVRTSDLPEPLLGASIRPLKKIVVNFNNGFNSMMESNQKERIKAALGDSGEFSWNSKIDSRGRVGRLWSKVMVDDANDGGEGASGHADLRAVMETSNGTADINEDVNDDSIAEEWSLGTLPGTHVWSAGPW